MGKGFIRRKNNLKMQYMKPLQEYCKKLEAENAALKNDPDTVVGQLIPQFRELLSQNKRLSVLAAAFIKSQGDKITVSKADMEAFQGMALSIKWELPEGVENADDATEFIFTYEAVKQEEVTPEATTEAEAPANVEATQQPEEVTPEAAPTTSEAGL